MKKPPAKGTSAKHAGAAKHGGTSKHAPASAKKPPKQAHGAKVTTKAKAPSHAKAASLALGDGVACCVAEALAASLRLRGWPVGEEDVLALHLAAGGTVDAGVAFPAAARAAMERGVAGVRPVSFGPALGCAPGVVVVTSLPGGRHAVAADARGVWSWGERYRSDLFLGAAEEAWKVVWPSWL